MSDTIWPSVSSSEIRTARTMHHCCECLRVIKPGEKYNIFKGCWEGKFDRFKTCLPCHELREEAAMQDYEGDGPAFGYLLEWATKWRKYVLLRTKFRKDS